ncbi:MAG: hypothetical protein JNJ85_12070 [Candidatus Kapabacteria bacterium]|nr:hypothetical protein [Candidatus Kapabacteria bacterium]
MKKLIYIVLLLFFTINVTAQLNGLYWNNYFLGHEVFEFSSDSSFKYYYNFCGETGIGTGRFKLYHSRLTLQFDTLSYHFAPTYTMSTSENYSDSITIQIQSQDYWSDTSAYNFNLLSLFKPNGKKIDEKSTFYKLKLDTVFVFKVHKSDSAFRLVIKQLGTINILDTTLLTNRNYLISVVTNPLAFARFINDGHISNKRIRTYTQQYCEIRDEDSFGFRRFYKCDYSLNAFTRFIKPK